MRRLLLVGSFLTAGALLGYGVVRRYEAPGPLARPVAVIVPRGGTEIVAAALRKAGVLEPGTSFAVFAAMTSWEGPLRSGEFLFPRGASLAAILAVLRVGRPVQHFLTIPEGLTSSRIAALSADAGGLVGDLEVPREGSVLPESYAYIHGAPRRELFARAARAMEAALDDAWNARSAGLALRSPRELLVLASIVEKETHLGRERPMVARVLLNRLQRGMRLQSDPTVVYGESGGSGTLPVGLTRAAMERFTPYNTYAKTGLPAGPICAPGAASIDAVAHPASSLALYFVNDGTGGLVFADTLEEHNRNVARYRAGLR